MESKRVQVQPQVQTPQLPPTNEEVNELIEKETDVLPEPEELKLEEKPIEETKEYQNKALVVSCQMLPDGSFNYAIISTSLIWNVGEIIEIKTNE